MTICRAIQRGDLQAVIANAHEMIQEIDKMEDGDIQWENYITFWIASHKDHDVATEMFKVFLQTCKNTYEPNVYEEVISLYAYPTMVGAVAAENLDILDLIKGYVQEADVHDEMIACHGKINPDYISMCS